jgi:CheY-like chemotaxis protein
MGLHILIVDDESQVREKLAVYLSASGHVVHQAADGKAAIRQLERQNFDLVISDIVMPERDGLEVLLYARKHCPETRVLAISAQGNELFLKSAKALGACGVLSKPFTLEELGEVVTEPNQADPSHAPTPRSC